MISTHRAFPGQLDTQAYFRQLKWRLRIGFLIALVIPFAALSVYFRFQFTFTLKESAKLNLIAISESQRNTIDLFLQERVVNIFSQFQSEAFSLTPSRSVMENYLKNLRRVSDAFVDVGFLNEKGSQIGYAGPYPHLQDKIYAHEKWFQTLIQQDRNHLISDIYLGFRNKPHFTIAVKQIIDGSLYVMRSTLDPDKFYMFLRTISHAKGVDSALINREGTYQIVDPGRGELLGLSDFQPSFQTGTGVAEVTKNDAPVLVAYAWLAETPWALIVREPLNISHGPIFRARQIIMAGTTLILAIITMGIWMTTNRLIDNARHNAESREELQQQLLHAAKLASVGELATGVAHEINNPLAIVLSTTGVIRDMLNPEFKLDASPENILKELDTVDSAVFRARNITRQLLDFGRKDPPRPVACNLNRLVDDVLGGFKLHALEVENITINKQFEADLPDIIADHDQIRQVLLNLINNAGDAISGAGTITISTARDGRNVRVTITDTGRGMTAQQLKKIFKPFYTTKETGKGTGLGLSVSRGIVKSMGGSIEVQSMPGAGSSFTVILPIDLTERQYDATATDTQQA
ncbi:MAG: ATP-binding protein [Deltaproteobacteria bacterium]|jgi:two-component system NtrC family sensor kinase|nr:ATP-binding protein [Deltaproteobacteria bacterium]